MKHSIKLMCLRVPYQAQTGTRNDKTQITYSKMICRWDVLSAVMRLDGSYYCFFKKNTNLGYFRIIKLCKHMRFNKNIFYYRNLLKYEYCFLEEEIDYFCIWIASCLRKMALPYYFFPSKNNFMSLF